MGDYFFDSNSEVLVYDFSFPNNTAVFFFKNELQVFQNDTLQLKTDQFSIETSVFNSLFYNSAIEDYISNSGYALVDVDFNEANEEIHVFQKNETSNKMLIKKFQNKLISVVSLSKNQVIDQLIIDSYFEIEGLKFPKEFFRITIVNNQEKKQWIKLSDSNRIDNSERLEILYKLL